jgi:pantoate--beta-alanine ligase
MQVITQCSEWQTLRKQFNPIKSIGFVATMGNLHAGHASLLQRCRQDNDISILSIYVNPTQFNDPNDLSNYPRTLEQDLLLAKDYQTDYVFVPNDHDIYINPFYQIISQHPLSQIMEGLARPNHFTGVLTIVMKLLMLTKADHAYFGEKDYQQLKLIEGLAAAFFLDTKIIACPTVRESSGLALSSRNNLLSLQERFDAAKLLEVLQENINCDTMKKKLIQCGFNVDYVEEHDHRIFAAIRIGKIRLIDNLLKNRKLNDAN